MMASLAAAEGAGPLPVLFACIPELPLEESTLFSHTTGRLCSPYGTLVKFRNKTSAAEPWTLTLLLCAGEDSNLALLHRGEQGFAQRNLALLRQRDLRRFCARAGQVEGEVTDLLVYLKNHFLSTNQVRQDGAKQTAEWSLLRGRAACTRVKDLTGGREHVSSRQQLTLVRPVHARLSC